VEDRSQRLASGGCGSVTRWSSQSHNPGRQCRSRQEAGVAEDGSRRRICRWRRLTESRSRLMVESRTRHDVA
jgi:hypothetical protein